MHSAHHGKFGFRSISARLFISVFLALVGFAIAFALLSQFAHNNSDSARNRAVASQIMTQIEPFLAEAENLSAQNNLLQARFSLVVIKKSFDIFDESLNAKIGLYDPQGRLVLQTENTELPTVLLPEPPWISEIFSPAPPHTIIESTLGYSLWYENRTPTPERPLMAWFNLFSGTILLLAIMSAVLWWISHSITWRINQMSRQMSRLGEGDFSVRVSEHGNDEIAVLAHGFNQSAQKIEQLINANSLLLAHASHEFRTPITRIRLQIEMMDMLAARLDDDTKAKFDKRAAAVNRDLTGLNDLVESILLVSRLDAGHALQAAEQVDLYELTRQECQHYPEATLIAEPVSLLAQPKLLTHLVRNLLNNAMIHGVPPIEVYLYGVADAKDATTIPQSLLDGVCCIDETDAEMTQPTEMLDAKSPKKTSDFLKRLTRTKEKEKEKAKPQPNFAVLAFIDQGLGIPEDKREDIFSPFVRLKQEKKGSGLGLSLVSQIVEAHQGKISTDTWQGHTRFLVVLPLKPKAVMNTDDKDKDKAKT
ncbi:ATP-binding protein [Moraxella sp. FZLJ2107]|uniref:sensor histidine kinase n=1 Tax=unclassified Moraxella TaxID=2685852 RepID=UPI0020C90C8D|nr:MULTISPECIES: ATP-binding protein [unclassified Moraxella]UTO04114.1 ATP-binding protein [Moraxella sp. FZLJ2107]UTO22947.1 ATP-binding protein [Moraxella sp. FZLJ2109]